MSGWSLCHEIERPTENENFSKKYNLSKLTWKKETPEPKKEFKAWKKKKEIEPVT